MTPGRAEESEEVVEQQTSSLTENAHKIIAALGSANNIENVDACITRLRVAVKEVKAVDKATLKNSVRLTCWKSVAVYKPYLEQKQYCIRAK